MFCQGAGEAIRTFAQHITPELSSLITDVTVITGKIKAIEVTPTAQAIEVAIPGGSKYEAAFNTGLDILAGAVTGAITVAERISQWISGNTPTAINGQLNKLAATVVKAADTVTDPVKTEVFYDSVVQNTFAIAAVKKEDAVTAAAQPTDPEVETPDN